MINIDRILGGLVQSVVSSALSHVVSRGTARNAGFKMGRVAARVDKKALGVGALGIAVAAFEHFSESNRPHSIDTANGEGVSGLPGRTPSAVPPPPPPGAVEKMKLPPTPPGAIDDTTIEGSPDALLLLRVMIAAASVDGVIDGDEQRAILNSLATAGLSRTETEFVDTELTHPRSIESLITGPLARELAEQVYTVAYLAINIDEDAERDFLRKLQGLLKLDNAVVERFHKSVD